MQVQLDPHTHLLVDGGVAGGGGQPHLFVELVTDRVRHVDGRVGVGAQDGPDRKQEAGQTTVMDSWAVLSPCSILAHMHSSKCAFEGLYRPSPSPSIVQAHRKSKSVKHIGALVALKEPHVTNNN